MAKPKQLNTVIQVFLPLKAQTEYEKDLRLFLALTVLTAVNIQF